MITRDEAMFCPYVGLRPFTEEHRDFFFGRERDQRLIASNILAVPLTILYGSSGVGKSSVLIAGVVPHLKEENKDCVVIVFREWQQEGFADELKKTCIAAVSLSDGADAGTLGSLPLDVLLNHLGEKSRKSILVIFDQFEEYFFYHPVGSSLSDTFESEFARAVNRDEATANFLIALREDSLHKLDRFRARIRDLLGNSLRLEQLDRKSAERAIRMPLERYNERFSTHFSIEDDLVREVLNQTRTGSLAAGLPSDIDIFESREPAPPGAIERIETPFLQLVMETLWVEETSQLRLITFQRLGGAREIGRTHLERKLEKLEPKERMLCSQFFDRLVTPSGFKVACRRDDLIQWAGKHAEQVPGILKHLEEGRILRRIEASSGSKDAPPLYEVFHDVLAGPILEWRKQYLKEQEIAEATRQAEEGRRQAEERTKLAEQERAKQRERAEEEARNAAVSFLRERIARAVNFLDSDPWLSGLLARDALKDARRIRNISVVNEATDALCRALAVSSVKLNFPAGRSNSEIALAYASKRSRLATISKDGTAKLWDAKSGTLCHSLTGNTPGIYRASFSPKEDLLAAVSGEDDAYVWNVDSGELVKKLSVEHSVVGDIAFSPDERFVATGTLSGDIQLWNTASWTPEIPFDKLRDELGLGGVRHIAFDPTGSKVAFAHEYGGVKLLNPHTGKVHVLGSKEGGAHNATVLWLAFSPNGERLATASGDNTAKLWNANTGELEHTLKGHWDQIGLLDFSPSGKEIVTSSLDYDARVWNAETGELVHTLSGHTNSVFEAIFSPSGKLIATVSADASARLWNAETGRFLFSLKGHIGPVEGLGFSSDGNTVFTSGWDGLAKAWAINSRHMGPVNQALFSERGQLATAGRDGTVKLWDPSGEVLQTLSGHQQPVQAVAFTPDGVRLATASVDHSVKIWELYTGKEIATLQGHKDAVNDVVYNPKDQNMLATAGFDRRVLLWVVGNGETYDELGSHGWQALHLAFSPDGSRLASAGAAGDAKIWNVKSKGMICKLSDPKLDNERAHYFQIDQIRFNPEGDYVVTSSQDHTAKIWRASDGHLVKVFEHESIVFDAQFNPCDGRTVITASSDNTAKIWEVSSGNLLQTLTGHTQPLSAARFDRVGRRIATASWDGTTKIWEKPSGKASFNEILTLTSSGQVITVDFSPDGSRIAIGSSTGVVIIFPFDGDELMELANKRFTRPLQPEE